MSSPDQDPALYRIYIDTSHPDEDYYETAVTLAMRLEMQIGQDPHAVTRAIGQLASSPDTDLSELNRRSYTDNVAAIIALLLDKTDHGGFIEFSDPIEAALMADERHRQLVKDAQNVDRRRGISPQQSKRRVALSRLGTFVQLHAEHTNNIKTDEAG